MRVRFQADADRDGRILRGLRRTAPEIDIRTAADAGLAGLGDPAVLRIAATRGESLSARTGARCLHISLASPLALKAPESSRWNRQLAEVHEREVKRGNRNRATLAVARKLVAYLLAVDKSGKPLEIRKPAVTEMEANQVA